MLITAVLAYCAVQSMTIQLHTVIYNTLDLTEFTRIMISRWTTRQVSIELLITEAGGWLNKYATQQNGSKNRLNIGSLCKLEYTNNNLTRAMSLMKSTLVSINNRSGWLCWMDGYLATHTTRLSARSVRLALAGSELGTHGAAIQFAATKPQCHLQFHNY